MQTNYFKMQNGQKEWQKISSHTSKIKYKLKSLFLNPQGTVFSQSKRRIIKECQINWNSELKMTTLHLNLLPRHKTKTRRKDYLDNLARTL
jgi:hypothetical protein